MKFCVIDDDAVSLKMLAKVLEKEGHEVVTETSGARAVDTAADFGAECVITDLIMSPVDGLEVCQEVRRHRTLKTVPVIMLSSNSEKRHYWQKRAEDFGADGYMVKPVHPGFVKELEEILAKIKR